MRTAHVTCPLCEATCGLEVALDGDTVIGIRGDRHDVFSQGFVCPKGASLRALHEDPDRVRTPLIKRNGVFVEAGWDEAFAEIDTRIRPLLNEHSRDAVAVYAGNPSVHNLSTVLYGPMLYRAIGTKNMYSASTVDQMPKHLSAGYMFGNALTIPVPDLDRTQHLLVLGANPLVSNGSVMTAPDVRGRLRALKARGGKLVVIDPSRTRTAEIADEHHAIRPGTDALLLFALVHVLFTENRLKLGRLEAFTNGLEDLRHLAEAFSPERVAPSTGISAEDIRLMARELAEAESAAVYGRMGASTQAFGTLTNWLMDVLNVLTGNLDRPGGAMFPCAAAGPGSASRPFTHGRWHSRVRGLPEVNGELPVATLADEILTPGDRQVRALVTVSGNPCLSTPDAGRLSEALGELEFMVSVDVYVNETTRHADVILPGPTPLERPHYDLALYQLAVRNVANWSPPAIHTDAPQEWQTMLRLIGIVNGMGPDTDVPTLDAAAATQLAERRGVDFSAVRDRVGPERLLDILLHAGPYDLTLADLETAPHGVDLGPLTPQLPEILSTASGMIDMAPSTITSDVPRLQAELDRVRDNELLLIGRRHLSSNNSWMHNVPSLVRGSNRCTVQMHPDDADDRGLIDGQVVEVSSATGSIQLPIEVTPAVRRGVVSVPHGWGHDVPGVITAVASAHAGANVNVLADAGRLDAVSGTAVLNGVPVQVISTAP